MIPGPWLRAPPFGREVAWEAAAGSEGQVQGPPPVRNPGDRRAVGGEGDDEGVEGDAFAWHTPSSTAADIRGDLSTAATPRYEAPRTRPPSSGAAWTTMGMTSDGRWKKETVANIQKQKTSKLDKLN